MDGKIEAVAADRPEILAFFSEFFIAHIRRTNEKNEIPMTAFDKLVGTTNPWPFARRIKLIAASMLHSRKFKILTTITLTLMMVTTVVLTSDIGRSWLGLKPTPIKPEIEFSLTNWAFLSGVLFFATYIICAMYSTSASTRFLKKARLWVAVIISVDNSTRSTEGFSALIRILGKQQHGKSQLKHANIILFLLQMRLT